MNNGPPIIKRQVLREDIKSYIIDFIMRGELKAGERVVETQIAKTLGVSQAPVREAIRDLEQSGILFTEPYKGTYVSEFTADDLKDAFDVRTALERLAVRSAVNQITDEELEELEDVYHKMLEKAHKGDKKNQIKLDILFHEIIIKASRNKILERVWKNVSIGNWTYFFTFLVDYDVIRLAERHKLILDALKKRDVQEAQKCVSDHFLELKELI